MQNIDHRCQAIRVPIYTVLGEKPAPEAIRRSGRSSLSTGKYARILRHDNSDCFALHINPARALNDSSETTKWESKARSVA